MPQVSIEFHVPDTTAVGPGGTGARGGWLRAAASPSPREEPWGHTVARLQSPECDRRDLVCPCPARPGLTGESEHDCSKFPHRQSQQPGRCSGDRCFHERPDAGTAAGHGGVIAGPGVRAVGAEVAGRWLRRRNCSGEAQLAAWDRRSSAGRRRVAQVGRADRAPAGRGDAPGHDEPLPQYDPGADGHPPSPRIPRFGDPDGHVVGLVKSA